MGFFPNMSSLIPRIQEKLKSIKHTPSTGVNLFKVQLKGNVLDTILFVSKRNVCHRKTAWWFTGSPTEGHRIISIFKLGEYLEIISFNPLLLNAGNPSMTSHWQSTSHCIVQKQTQYISSFLHRVTQKYLL